MFFVDGFGGTGKTFLWKSLSYRLRSEGKIVINVASSRIAALLLPGGRTAHSQFGIPLVLDEESCCRLKKDDDRVELLRRASLIIWDEAPMINRMAFEAFDRSMRDIMSTNTSENSDKIFGGKPVVFGGDFRQILPVILKGSQVDIVYATLNSSRLWRHCKILKLTKNMRVQMTGNLEERQLIKEFSDWILKIGYGKIGLGEDGEYDVEMFEDVLITCLENPIGKIVETIFPNLIQSMKIPNFFEDKSILAPTLEIVERVNDCVISLILGEGKEYLSCDSICKVDQDVQIDHRWITVEFLNDIKCSGLPNHKLFFKKGVPVMLLRNIEVAAGLCNGTRLIIEDLGVNVFGARVITETNIGQKVYITRMNLIPSDANVAISFQRRQFPLTLCFAMSINKSQGQTLTKVGLYLPRSVFSHGQLYVAISRVRTRPCLKVLITDDVGCSINFTKNIVYHEVFQKI